VAEATSRYHCSARLAAALVALLVLGAACSSGDDDSAGSDKTGRDTDHRATTTTTTTTPDEPVGTKPMAVTPYIQKLLKRYDAAVEKIVADPAVAKDRDDPATKEFLSLFEPGNEFAEGSLKGWVANADKGVTITRAQRSQALTRTRLEGPPQGVDEDKVTFGQCTILAYVTTTNGAVTERVDQRRLAGNGTVVRYRGHWLLDDISTPAGMKGCIAEGGATP
jgi:hypothetical protein